MMIVINAKIFITNSPMSCRSYSYATSKRRLITQSSDQVSTLETMGLNTTEAAGNKDKRIVIFY